ncbi:MAG: hypothetical protein HY075_12280, partial [Deltaproteobacteria bacterium]|nr:hypothetical protein [Deltaproteobacteria bacterium]
MNHAASKIALTLLVFATSLEISSQSAFSATKAVAGKAPKTEQNRKSALQEMQAKYKDVKTLAAEFTQKQTNV